MLLGPNPTKSNRTTPTRQRRRQGGGPAEAGLADLGGRRAAETATRD
jgi:hypothetical protein